ncbi:MAG TPA: GNAT family N-acetyltransferase [Vicinamibacterales bacterium]|nr:GNAT family N-acetyltransferase [Vicinamibacterales bacterium]
MRPYHRGNRTTGQVTDPQALTVGLVSFTAIAEYEAIPIAFTVREVADVRRTPGGFDLAIRRIHHPWIKDYDAQPDGRPSQWSLRFDVTHWQLFLAWRGDAVVGGAAMARDSTGVDLLEGRTDLALLWDIRVAPAARGRGVGTALFDRAALWAASVGCRTLKVETQDVNVRACRFYARQGCALRAVDPRAYASHPDEIQLMWYKELTLSSA